VDKTLNWTCPKRKPIQTQLRWAMPIANASGIERLYSAKATGFASRKRQMPIGE
jgi:hypothetical protein